MLGKMLVHGLAAAILIGSAAAVYAQVEDEGFLSPGAAAGRAEVKAADGYLRPEKWLRSGEGKHDEDDD